MQSSIKINKRLENHNKQIFIQHLDSAARNLKNGLTAEAWNSFHDALTIDYDSIEAKSGMKIAGYWKERQKQLSEIKEDYDKGEFLLRECKYFYKRFVPRLETKPEQFLKSINKWIFSEAYSAYSKAELNTKEPDAELLLKKGYCLKKTGNYEQALNHLENAINLKKDSARILAELADIYSLINEDKLSKFFFREAFFINPQEVDLDSLESVLIKRIAEQLEENEYTAEELKEWIPVYGVLLGLFNVKKDLKPIEAGMMKQSIYSLNNQLSSGNGDKGILIPRLINHYFRLLEYLINKKAGKDEIDEVLLNIKLIDKKIYELYLN